MQCSIGGTDARNVLASAAPLVTDCGGSTGATGLTISTCPYKELCLSNVASTSLAVRVTAQGRKELHELPSLTPLTVLAIRGVL